MATIIIITPPKRPKQIHEQAGGHDSREFDVPDGLSFADSLRYIADQVEAEE